MPMVSARSGESSASIDTGTAVLVSGGAGYIGSHTVLALLEHGYRVVVVDDLSTGSREAVPAHVPWALGNIADTEFVMRVMHEHKVRDVIHFAGSIRVEESMQDPLKYYGNNTCASRAFVAACARHGVDRFIFSSTAAAYGNAETIPIGEDAPIAPTNPYGRSKVMTEQMLKDVAERKMLRVGVLRYFNVAGADPAGRVGQRSRVATHLIKIACEVAAGKREAMKIYGVDYATPDGTCIRDFIHVSDLADAHVRVLGWLSADQTFEVLNCGYGRGHSVREVLRCVEVVAGRKIKAVPTDRRQGDAVALVADPTRLKERTGWTPRYDSLTAIVRTALDWERTI